MYVYIQSEPGLWSVGHYIPNTGVGYKGEEFVAESDHHSKQDAADRVHYLNGGAVDYRKQDELELMSRREEI